MTYRAPSCEGDGTRDLVLVKISDRFPWLWVQAGLTLSLVSLQAGVTLNASTGLALGILPPIANRIGECVLTVAIRVCRDCGVVAGRSRNTCWREGDVWRSDSHPGSLERPFPGCVGKARHCSNFEIASFNFNFF